MNKLNKIKIFVLLFLMIFIFSFDNATNKAVGKVTFPLGNVLLIGKGQTRYKKVTFNMPVYNGDKVETKRQARCEIKFNDGSLVRIDEQSIYTIQKADFDKKKKEVQSKLTLGKLWANVKKLVGSSSSWKLKSPAAIVAVRGTIYRMNQNPDSSAQVLVYDGEIAVSQPEKSAADQQKSMGPPKQVQGPVQVQGPKEVSMEEWVEIVKAQQQISIGADGKYTKSEFSMQQDSQLDWVKWNRERDKMFEEQ